MTAIIAAGVPTPGIVAIVLDDGRTIDLPWQAALHFSGVIQFAAADAARRDGIPQDEYRAKAQHLITTGADTAIKTANEQAAGAPIPPLPERLQAIPGIGITTEGNKVWVEISGEFNATNAMHLGWLMTRLAAAVVITDHPNDNFMQRQARMDQIMRNATNEAEPVVAEHMRRTFRPGTP